MPVTRRGTGARQRYCSNACRQRAYRQRLAARDGPLPAEQPLPFDVGGSLPIRLDKFIGRAREMEFLAPLSESRLLTLTGPPGSGKSRLTLHHVQEGLAESAAVGWVDLADWGRPDGDGAPGAGGKTAGVAEAVGKMLGIATPDETALIDALGSQPQLILVFDNCEHVLDECAPLVEALLTNCQGLRVIATSREVLRIPGEIVFSVRPLPLPAAASSPGSPRALLRSDAVRLFVERASAINPEFILSQANAAAIAELCTELDGLPLPIELAARRVGLLSISDLLTRLRQSTRVLNVSSRTANRRHASLEAALHVSYRSLSPLERETLRRLSILSGGFGLDVAAAVARAEGQPEQEVVDAIGRLQTKALLLTSVDSAQNVEFRQLNTVRRYARERLEEAGEVDATWDRLVNWLVEVSRPLRVSIAPAAEVRARLEQLHEHLLSGAEWAAERHDERNFRLVVALAQSSRPRRPGYTTELLVRHALRAIRGNEIDRALMLMELAYAKRQSGYLTDAAELAEQAVTILRPHGPVGQLACALLELAACHSESGALAAAADDAEQALRIARSVGEPAGVALCLETLAVTHLLAMRLEQAAPLGDEALETAVTAATLCTAADIALAQGRLDVAEWHATQAVRRATAEARWLYRPLLRLAGVAIRGRDRQRAQALVGAARAMRPESDGDQGSILDRRREAELEDWEATLLPAEVREIQALTAAVSGPAARAFAVGEADLQLIRDDMANIILSERQRVIACLVAEGLTNRQIATRVGISQRAVTTHLAKLRVQLDLPSRTQLAAWARATLQLGGGAVLTR